MEFKRVKEWAETANVFQATFILLGGAVSGRMTSLTGAPLWAVILAGLLGMILFLLLLIFYKRNDPEKAWIYKTFIIIVAVGALSVIDAKVSGWISKALFSPQAQVRKWLDELHYKSDSVDPPPQGQIFRYDVTNEKENRKFAIYQESNNPDTIVMFADVLTQDFFNGLPPNERDKVWLDMGLALIRSDIKISPVARFGPLRVVNWFPFGAETTRQQFFTEVRRFNMALETINVLVERKVLTKDQR